MKLFKYTMYAVIAMMATGCATQKMADKYYDRHPEKLAEKCAEAYPPRDSLVVRDSVHFDTLYQESPVLTDTLYVKGETLYVKRPCPPSQIVTKYVTRDTTIYRENTARVKLLEAQISAKDKEIATLSAQKQEAQERAKEKATALWWHRLLIVALLIWILRKPILSLITPIKRFYPF